MYPSDLKARFTGIYNRENDSLFRFCLLRVSSRDEALDITQETFTRLWVGMSSGKSFEKPKAFLFTVARNLIIDWYRKKKSMSLESLMTDNDEDRELEVPDPASFQEIETHSEARRVVALINSLEPQYREVIYLRFMEGMQPREIAEILKLKTNIISVRLTRGLEALRKIAGIKNK